MPSSHEALAVILAVITALMVTVLAVIAGTGVFGAPQALQGNAPSASCLEWTDGCMVCTRTPQGPACSTPGIACTPKAAQCVRR